MTVELSNEMFKAMRHAVMALVHERTLANRNVPPPVAAAYHKLVTGSGHKDIQFICDTAESEPVGDMIGTATTALLLGWSERTVRRRAVELGGIRPTGRDLVFSRRSVADYIDQNRKALSA